jgi:hypothetical protein
MINYVRRGYSALAKIRDYFATKEVSKQFRQEGGDANVICRLGMSLVFKSSYSTLFIHYFSEA